MHGVIKAINQTHHKTWSCAFEITTLVFFPAQQHKRKCLVFPLNGERCSQKMVILVSVGMIWLFVVGL